MKTTNIHAYSLLLLSIEDLVRKCFNAAATKMNILPEDDLNVAVHNFVEKDDKHAIAE